MQPRHLEIRPIDSLHPAKRNPRTHTRKQVRQIADSIQRFGFTNPILIDDDDRILAGHDLPLSCHPVAIRASAVCMPCGAVGATDNRRSWWSVAVSLAA